MLHAVVGILGFFGGSSAHLRASCTASSKGVVQVQRSAGRAVYAVADDASLLKSMSDSFYATKRARLEAEHAARLAELEEFEAREKALVSLEPTDAAPIAGDQNLQALLEAEKAKSAALEAELAQARLDSEIALQKVAAFWYAHLYSMSPLAHRGKSAYDSKSLFPMNTGLERCLKESPHQLFLLSLPVRLYLGQLKTLSPPCRNPLILT